MLDLLRDGSVFGYKAEYVMKSTEWQERGLPHVHILVRLRMDGPVTVEHINRWISARKPQIPPDLHGTRYVLCNVAYRTSTAPTV